jgi:alkylation response protein AidB-like acyl-CoA dehydrogenase
MDLTYSAEEEAFRGELRAWLDSNLPQEWREPGFWLSMSEAEGFDARRKWEAGKAKAGFAGIQWPKEFGGRGGTPGMKAIYDEEMSRAGAPESANGLGLTFLAPTVMLLGTDEQKRDIIAPMLHNEVIWVQGFSEPGAGSDLAALRTSGVQEGDEFIINGQKVWTTQAMHGDKIFTLVRTGEGSSKHEGISMLLIDMDQPGVDARPLRQISGESHFGEVFFTDARCKVVDNLGGIGNGWRTAMLLLSFERGSSAIGQYTQFSEQLDQIVRVAKQVTRADGTTAADDPLLKDALAKQAVELECLRYHSMHILSEVEKGHDLGFEASMTKLQWSETMQDLWEIFDDILGPDVTVQRPFGVDDDVLAMQKMGMWSRSVTIWGGSSQVQRNVVAERVLGLPR